MAKQFDLSVIFRVLDKATGNLNKIGQGFKQLTNPVDAANKSMQATGQSLRDVGKRMTDIGKSMSLKLTLPITAMATAATKLAIDFESSFTGVRKTVDATESGFQKLREGLRKMAREDVPLATEELDGIAESAGQLGIQNKNILSFTKVMADLGATTNLAASEAATQLARFSNIVGMSQDDFDRLGSTIVDLGNNFATTEAEITAIGLRLAASGKLIGLTESQILGIGTALSSLGVEAEAGGTAFSQVMRKIDKEIGTGSQKMSGFAYISGKTVEEFERSWKEDAAGALISFVEGIGELEKEGINVNQVLDELGFEGIRISDSLLRASGSGDLLRRAMERGSTAWKENIALTKESELRYKTTASRLTMFMNRIKQTAAALAESFLPVLLKITDIMRPFLDRLRQSSPLTRTLIIVAGALAAALGPLIVILGNVAAGFGLLLSVATPAFIAILVLSAKVVAAIAIVGIAVGLMIVYWKEWTEIVDKWGALMLSILAAVALPISTALAAFAAIAAAAVLIIQNWEDVKQFFVNLWNEPIKTMTNAFDYMKNLAIDFGNWISNAFSGIGDAIKSVLPDFLVKGLGLDVRVPAMATAGGVGGMGGNIRAMSAAPLQKSETDINIKVTADQGSTATIEKVKPKLGDAKVRVATEGYLGGAF